MIPIQDNILACCIFIVDHPDADTYAWKYNTKYSGTIDKITLMVKFYRFKLAKLDLVSD